jgi:alpha-N-arabinofuranosidase
VLPVSSQDSDKTNFFASAVRDNQSKDIILKIVNSSSQESSATIHVVGLPPGAQRAQATVLTSENTANENSFDQPRKVAPVTVSIGEVGDKFDYTFKPNSLTVLKFGPGNE